LVKYNILQVIAMDRVANYADDMSPMTQFELTGDDSCIW